MKKIIFGITALLMSTAVMAEGIGLTINIDPIGYMNHTITTTYNGVGAFNKELEQQLKATLGEGNLKVEDQKQRDVYNAYALGLDVRYSFFYLNLALGFPTKIYTSGFDPVAAAYPDAYKNSAKIGGTIILDGQIGGGVDLMKLLKKNDKLSVYLGGGLAVNYVHVKRDISKDSSLKILLGLNTEQRNIVQMGLGLQAGVTYKFIPNVGIHVGLSDSLLFVKLYSQRKFTGTTSSGVTYSYFLTENGKDNEAIKYQFANNFVLRFGVGINF